MSQQNTVDANQAGQPGEQEEPVLTGVLADQSDVLLDENGDGHVGQRDAEEWEERESRNQLKHVAGLGELQDVTDAFAQRHPQAVQRVVNAVVKTTHQYSDENRRAELFAQWGKTEYPEKVWREDFVGQPLRVRLSPLLDPFLVGIYKDSAEQALQLKLIRKKPEIDSWFDRRYLNTALKELQLEGYWPSYAADGKLQTR